MSRRWRQRGAVAVETALTLPLLILLTVGGLSILWWLYNKTLLQMMVHETARERAGDGRWVTATIKDVRDTVAGPRQTYGLNDVRFASLHLPTDPALVMAVACTSPGGQVRLPPMVVGSTGAKSSGGVVEEAADLLRRIQELEGRAEAEVLDPAISWGERLIWYRRVVENLTDKSLQRRRQAMDYLVGGALEVGARAYCEHQAGGGEAIAAKAVIRGERTYQQR